MKLDVKRYIEKETARLSEVVSQMNIIPKLVLINASNDTASETYINNKVKQCQKIGIESEVIRFDETVTNEELIKLISALNNDDAVTGVLIQVPLFEHLDEDLILNSLSSEKDVDGFTNTNQGKLLNGCRDLTACTPKGIVDFLKSEGVLFPGMNTVIVNRSRIVGKPLAMLLLDENCNVEILHSKTKIDDLYDKVYNADLVITAIGKPKFWKGYNFKYGSCIVDVSINFNEQGKLCGDIDKLDYDYLDDKDCKYTTVPGGVGPLTVLSLCKNVIEIAMKKCH